MVEKAQQQMCAEAGLSVSTVRKCVCVLVCKLLSSFIHIVHSVEWHCSYLQVGLSTSVKPIWKTPQRHGQRFGSWVIFFFFLIIAG